MSFVARELVLDLVPGGPALIGETKCSLCQTTPPWVAQGDGEALARLRAQMRLSLRRD